jgi:multicomponent Na+:H+ antiporter subunit E
MTLDPRRLSQAATPDVVRRTRGFNRRADLVVGAVAVAIWILLWGELSIANLVSGAILAALLLVAFPMDHDVPAVRHRIRPHAILRLAGFFVADVVRSTLVTALDALRPRTQIRTGIVACPLRVRNDGLVTFLANLIALSPGTMPIDVAYDPHVIYVHSLRGDDPEAVRAFVTRLEHLSVLAFGGAEAVQALEVLASVDDAALDSDDREEDRP